MYRYKVILLSVFVLVALTASVKGKHVLPELVGPPRNITSTKRIIAHGYPAEWHSLETYDGYKLNFVRIPHSSKESPSQRLQRPAILLVHGLGSSSDVYLLTGPNSGLPFLLADAGYDVWLANVRGNTYSKRHRKFSSNTREFWKFSWHEIGAIDVAATIDYILQFTGEKKLHFVGHSQGGTVYLVLMSIRPEYNEKIKTSHLLAPVAFQGYSRFSLFKKIAPIVGYPNKWSRLIMDREYYPGNAYIQRLFDMACGGDVRLPKVCPYIFGDWFGEPKGNSNMSIGPLLAETHPAGSSTNQLIHYVQGYYVNTFRQFDHGVEENIIRYGQPSPPDYQLDKITSPVYIYYSEYDEISTAEDIRKLASKLPNLILNHLVTSPNWTHMDFVVGLDIKRQINDLIVQFCLESDSLVSN